MLDRVKRLLRSITLLSHPKSSIVSNKHADVALQEVAEQAHHEEEQETILPQEEFFEPPNMFLPPEEASPFNYALMKLASHSVNTGGWKLYTQLREKQGNLFFSPYSIASLLAMSCLGARGETAKQIKELLQLDKDAHEAFSELEKFLTSSTSSGAYQFYVANALWEQCGIFLLIDFVELTHQYYHTVPKPVDFTNDTEQARRVINQWIEKNTKNQIKELLEPGNVSSQTRLIVTNATYFKGNWVFPFDENKTQEMPFMISENHRVMLPTMVLEEMFKYMEDEKIQLVELLYKGNLLEKDGLSMIIILPKKINGLMAIEKELPSSLEKWLQMEDVENVRIYLPKFKLESTFRLRGVLERLGMWDAFQRDKANFSGMTNEKNWAISTIVHKVLIEVDEKGTETLMATDSGLDLGGDFDVKEFRADHPFIFLIRDNISGAILFFGRVINPPGKLITH